MKKTIISTSITLICLIYINTSFANKEHAEIESRIIDKRNIWLEDIKNNVITHSPEEGSKAAQWDSNISNEYTKITGERKTLAEADKSTDPKYLLEIFQKILFADIKIKGKYQKVDIESSPRFKILQSLYHQGSLANDNSKNKIRSIDDILKDKFSRGNPNQVLDKNGNYLANYSKIAGSSFPSEPTWNGFQLASLLAMAFPERGSEIFTKAIKYGESQVVTGTHFPTDTIASRAANYYLLAQLLSDDKTAQEFSILAATTRKNISKKYFCSAIQQCLTKPDNITDNKIGYYNTKEANDAPIITPNDLPKNAAYLLRFRFPYLDNAQRQTILASTAYPTNSIAGWNIKPGKPDTYWGLIDLPKAYNGPSYLYDTFVVQHTSNEYSFAITFDEWKNNISGPGRLIKNGKSTLTLSGKNSFAGFELNQGEFKLTGENSYSKKSDINGGVLHLIGSLNSPLDINKGSLDLKKGQINSLVNVNDSGLLIGNGQIGDLVVNQGATLIPGPKSETLKITNSVTFEPGSLYLVEVNANGKHDAIISQGTATLNGGMVNVSMEGKKPLLPIQSVINLFDTKYTILSAKNGIKGKFDTVQPNYLFIGATLDYSPNEVTLNISRNSTTFESLAVTPNQKSVAKLIEQLPITNLLHNSILLNNSTEDVIATFDFFTGQIHADILSDQLNNTRHVRKTLLEQLSLSEFNNGIRGPDENKGNLWTKVLYNSDHTASDGNAESYNSSTNGIFLGADQRFYNDNIALGLAVGATQNTLSSISSHSNSSNYHLAAYGGVLLAPISVRAGMEHTWNNIDTKTKQKTSLSEDGKFATYHAHTKQAFIETAYPLKMAMMNIEPFANLAYINSTSYKIDEENSVVSLQGREQQIDALLSTLGARIDNQWQVNKTSRIGIYSELGWQHQYGNLEREAKFKYFDVETPFVSKSVPGSRNAVAIKIGSDLQINKDYKISLDYSKLISNNYTNNHIDAKVSLSF